MAHQWRFFRAGGFDQVLLETGADLVALGELDQKLWVALACPVNGLEFDRRTLDLIDTDRDGRVRASELLAAIRWAASLVVDVESFARGSASLPLAMVNTKTNEGKLVAKTASALLASLGKADAKAIDAGDMDAALASFVAQPFNGDGILPVASVPDEADRAAVADLLSCVASPPIDRGGQPGLDGATLGALFADAAAWLAWRDAAPAPLGDATAAAHAAVSAVAAKVDDWFARVRLAEFDPRARQVVNADLDAWRAITSTDLVSVDRVRAFPLADVSPGRALPLVEGVNPAWSAEISALREAAVRPALGQREALAGAEWQELRGRLAPYEAWLAAKPASAVEKLGEARVRALVTSGVKERVEALVAEDAAAKPMSDAIESVERLVRYHRDLLELANNFVSFRSFYGRRGLAVFQAGTLYLDQRACNLCLRVADAGRHAQMAPLARTYLVYCDLRNAAGEKMSIAAAMTNGDIDNLMVGRNGVFYDRQGRDWDATVTSIVDNPISVRQAFWSPYKKFLKLVEEQIAARVGAAAAASDEAVTVSATHVGEATKGAPPKEVKPFDVGVVAALGVAVGGITAAFGALLSAFFDLGMWMPLGVVGLILAISGPSMAIAWLKLRQRNLGPLLDANGWAVNARARVNVPLGESLTDVAVLPPGASRQINDPFAEKNQPWGFYAGVVVVLALVVGWYMGKLDPYLPPQARSVTVLGELAPANKTPELAPPAP